MKKKNKVFLGIGIGLIILVGLIVMLINFGVTFHLKFLGFRVDIPNPNKDLKLTSQIDETLRNQVVNDLMESRDFYISNLDNLNIIKEALQLPNDYEDQVLKVGIAQAIKSNVTSEEILSQDTLWYFKGNNVGITLKSKERNGYYHINAVKIGDKWFWW